MRDHYYHRTLYRSIQSEPDSHVEFDIGKGHWSYKLASDCNMSGSYKVKKNLCDGIAAYLITNTPRNIMTNRTLGVDKNLLEDDINEERVFEFMLTVLLPLATRSQIKDLLEMTDYNEARTMEEWCKNDFFPFIGKKSREQLRYSRDIDDDNCIRHSILSHVLGNDITKVVWDLTDDEKRSRTQEFIDEFNRNSTQVKQFFDGANNLLTFIQEPEMWMRENYNPGKLGINEEQIKNFYKEVSTIVHRISASELGASGFMSPFNRNVKRNVVYFLNSDPENKSTASPNKSDVEMLMTVSKSSVPTLQDIFQVHLGIFRPQYHLTECLVQKNELLKEVFEIPKHRTFHQNISLRLHTFAAEVFKSKIILSQPMPKMKEILMSKHSALKSEVNEHSLTVEHSGIKYTLDDSDLLHLCTGMGIGEFVALDGKDLTTRVKPQM
jgi:hypothetical protein